MTSLSILKLKIGRVGLFEMIIALYPIMAGYAYGIVHLNDVILLVLCVMAYARTHSLMQYRQLQIFALLLAMHELIVWLCLPDMPIYMVNNTFSSLLCVLSISIIVPAIDYEKFINSIILVSIISTLGLVYHFILITTGHSVTPIPLPFLPQPPMTSRLFEVGHRPVSFFWEPAAYANYMLVPMAYFLTKRNFAILGVIMIAMFLSTSSTAVVLSLLMLFLYIVLGKGTGMWLRIVMLLFMAAMIYVLLNSSLFVTSVDKIKNTDVETTSRLFNGPELFRNMSFIDFLIGIPFANVSDFYYQYAVSHGSRLLTKEHTVFVPTFYVIIAKYGILLFLFYLNIFIEPIKRYRELWPYVGILFIAFFFASNAIGASFVFQMIFIYTYALHKEIENEYES